MTRFDSNSDPIYQRDSRKTYILSWQGKSRRYLESCKWRFPFVRCTICFYSGGATLHRRGSGPSLSSPFSSLNNGHTKRRGFSHASLRNRVRLFGFNDPAKIVAIYKVERVHTPFVVDMSSFFRIRSTDYVRTFSCGKFFSFFQRTMLVWTFTFARIVVVCPSNGESLLNVFALVRRVSFENFKHLHNGRHFCIL